MSGFDTHEVFNQTPAYDGVNLFASDRALRAAVEFENAQWAVNDLMQAGSQLGTAQQFARGHRANKFTPELHSFDMRGYRHDQVEFHPDYHHFMDQSKALRIHCGAYDYLADDGRYKGRGVAVARAAKHYMVSQVEPGHICPITMTHAAIPALRVQPDIAREWLPKILDPGYDPRFCSHVDKASVTIGMGMTEKQGGTDVRTNTTVARPINEKGGGRPYSITGHKWFMSAPMSDAFLVLAQAEEGLSVFLVPRFRADGEVNGLRFQRLKNKLGNRSNASSEVEFTDAEGFLLGEEGRGIANIMTMANYTRLDCALGSAGMMRQALSRAFYHVRERIVFQRKLIDQPMMSAVIADLTIESEASTTLSMWLAGVYEAADHGDDVAARLARLMTPVIKYWVTKRAPGFAFEAMECVGGNGYVEDDILARIYRDIPVNSIWEGAGSVMCLDLLRVIARDPDAFESVRVWLESHRGNDGRYDQALDVVSDFARPGQISEAAGRRLCEHLATLASAKLLMERAPDSISNAYIGSRLDPEGRSGTYGVLPSDVRPQQIIEPSLLL